MTGPGTRWARAVAAFGLLAAAAAAPVPAHAAESCDQRTAPVYLPEPSYPLEQYRAATSLWAAGIEGDGVLVAVLDSGLNADNPHFTQSGYGTAVQPGTSFIAETPDTQQVRDPRGLRDLHEHGTSVAGLIAARPVPGSGVVGLARRATILPVQVYGVRSSADPRYAALLPKPEQLVAGIRYAADAGAKVIAIAMSQNQPTPELEAAVGYAQQKGALIVASAGDRAPDQPAGLRYPAAYPGVLGVTAVTQGGLASPTVMPGRHVGVAAPGERLNTTYGRFGDCLVGPAPEASYAVPLVAATAALLVGRYPQEGPALWKYRIEASAIRPRSEVRDDTLGWGLLAPYDAVTLTLDPDRPGPQLPGQAPGLRAEQPRTPAPMSLPEDALVGPRRFGLIVLLTALLGALTLRLVRALRAGTRAPGTDPSDPHGGLGPGPGRAW